MESKELKASIEERKNNVIATINTMNERFHNLNTKLYKAMNDNKMLLDEGVNINRLLKGLAFIPHESTEFIVERDKNAIRVNLTETMSVSYDGKVITFTRKGNVSVMINTNKVRVERELESNDMPNIPFNELTLTQLVIIDNISIHLASAYFIIKDVIDGYNMLANLVVETI